MPIALVMSSTASLETSTSHGSRLVAADGRELPLTGAHVRAEASGGIARTVVEQEFANPHAEPLSVTYSLPLPADGAVSGFSFVVGGRRIAGEVAKRAEARATFERAIVEGRSAALLEQDRSSLFTQEIGNIPPGATIVAEITVDQPLKWLDEGAWEWRFPTVVAPRYLGAPGRVADAGRVAQDVADGPIAARFTLACEIRDELAEGRKPECPSHAQTAAVTCEGEPGSYRRSGAVQVSEKTRVRRASVCVREGARLDRDIVVRWAVSTPRVGLSLGTARPARSGARSDRAHGLLTIVPPEPKARGSAVHRDLIVLLDTSGSMGGEPLDQARRVVSALIDTLGQSDSLEMIEFSNTARRWKPRAEKATGAVKRDALSWVKKLQAGGGTEMRTGILEALREVRPDAQRQVVVVTDGQIGFETEVIAAICEKLPKSSRLHMVGVGSAVNRSLTGPAARAGRGIEAIVGLGEDAERAARRLVARTDAPIVVDLKIEGSAVIDHAPRRLPDLFAGAPVLVGLDLNPEGGELLVRGRTAGGTWEQRLSVAPIDFASGSMAVAALFGREAIEDMELSIAAGARRRPLDEAIEKLGLDFQLATRLTSWIAVTQEVTVDPDAARRRERMPHELPHGMSAEGVGLREAADRSGEGPSLTRAGTIGPEGQRILAAIQSGDMKAARDLFALHSRAPARIGAAEPAPPSADDELKTVSRLAVLADEEEGETSRVFAPPKAMPMPPARDESLAFSLSQLKGAAVPERFGAGSGGAPESSDPNVDELMAERPAPEKKYAPPVQSSASMAPGPTGAPRQTIRADMSPEEALAPRSRRGGAPWFLLAVVAAAAAYYFTGSFLVTFGVACLTIVLVILALRRLTR